MNTTTSPRIVRELRTILFVARILAGLGMAAALFAALPVPFFTTSVEVPFETKPISAQADYPITVGDVQVARLVGTVMFHSNNAATDEMVAVRRIAVVPTLFVTSLFSFIVAHLLIQLLANIQRGDVFTERNFQLLRNVGYASISCAVVECLAHTWADFRIGSFLARHATFAPLQIAQFPGGYLAHFDLRFFAAGMLVLVVAYAFKQGVALKQESELTV